MPKKTPNANTTPQVSIVMPAYNAEQFIGEVIATILGQTFSDFELIIIDDGSKDKTAAIIKEYAKMDNRIKYFYQKNKGSAKLAETINIGISKTTAPLIARADADDPWFLDKLEKQVAFMDENPDYVLVGGTAEVTNERGQHLYTLVSPIEDADHRRSLSLYTTLAHGSVMFRKEAFDKTGGYKNIHAAEDLELWQRMSDIGKIHNLPDPLFKYRRNTQGISMANWWIQGQEIDRLGDLFFNSHTPAVLSKSDLRTRLSAINKLEADGVLPHQVVIETQTKLLDDNRRIAKKFLQKGMKKEWIQQYTAVAFSSSLGFKMVVRSSFLKVKAKLKNLLRHK